MNWNHCDVDSQDQWSCPKLCCDVHARRSRRIADGVPDRRREQRRPGATRSWRGGLELGILSAVGVADQASYLGLHAAHDDFHASIPLPPILNRGFVIYEQDGEPLAVAAGGPFRFAIQDFAACHTSEIDEWHGSWIISN